MEKEQEKKSMRPKIVAIDDEKNMLEIYEATLEDICDIYLFDNPLKALSFIDENEIFLVILDRKMPIMSGDEVCKKLRSNSKTKDIIIVIVSGITNIDDIIEIMPKHKIDNYFTKPISLNRLQNYIVSKIKERFTS